MLLIPVGSAATHPTPITSSSRAATHSICFTWRRRAECDWGTGADVGAAVDNFADGRRLAMLAIVRADVLLRKGNRGRRCGATDP